MRIAAFAAAISIVLAGFASADEAHAAIRKPTHIPGQGLGSALRALAKERKFQVLFRSDLVRDERTGGAAGELTTDEALLQLLSGTELTFQYLDENTITIVPLAQANGSPASEGTRPAAAKQDSDQRSSAGQTQDSTDKQQSLWQKLRLAQADTASTQEDQKSEVPSSSTGKVDEVVVSAQRRKENLQDVPISISVLGGKELDAASYTDVTDALESVPGLDASNRDIFTGGVQLSLRGVTNGITRAGGAGPIAYYVDSVPFGFVRHAIYPDAGSYDLSRVEVLNGPQGTLYGAGSLNGVVRVLSEDADPENFEFKARAATSMTEGGGQNHRGSFALNVPMIEDRLAFRASVDALNNDGWIDSPLGRNVNNQERQDYRIKLRALPTDRLTIDLLAWRMENENGAPHQADNAQRSSVTHEQPQRSQFDVYGLRLEQEFSGFTVSSMSSWIDFSSVGILDGGVNDTPTLALLDVQLNSTVFSQEVNLVSNGEGPWRWSAGAFYRDAEDGTYQFLTGYGPPLTGVLFLQNNYTDTSESYAVYGEVGYDLTDELDLSVGLRYFDDEQSTILNKVYGALPVGTTFASTSEAVTPRVVLTWTPSDEQTFYASYSQGFRSGFAQQPNVQATFPGQFPSVDPDTLTNYEVGAKGDLFDGVLGYEVALYFIDWQDIQQNVSVLVPPLSTTATLNAESASGPGASLALTFQPTDNLTLSSNVAWNDLTFDENVVQPGAGLLYLAGERLTTSPEWTAGVSAEYSSWDLGGGFEARTLVSADYTSPLTTPIDTSLATRTSGEGPSIIRASARFSIDAPNNWTGTIFVDNLTDNNDSAYSRIGGGSRDWAPRVAPRTCGVQLEYRFE